MTKHLLLAASLLTVTQALAANGLPPLQFAADSTVSGLSSGAYMAGQYHLAFSDEVKGAALIAGGPWGCANSDLVTALSHCMAKPGAAPDEKRMQTELQQAARSNQIAPLSHIKGAPVYLLHGTKDQTVSSVVHQALVRQYQQLGANLVNDDTHPFAHHWPTVNYGSDCQGSEPPYLAACQFDTAGALLKTLYGELKPAAPSMSGSLYPVNQASLAGAHANTLAKTGYVYVPTACAEGASCRLHIAFHGCKQNAELVQDSFTKHSGLNEYADTNQLVILYPQTKATMPTPLNPNACWDWWGYSGGNPTSRDAPQLQAVHTLAQALRHRE